jgi:hypothetical protein
MMYATADHAALLDDIAMYNLADKINKQQMLHEYINIFLSIFVMMASIFQMITAFSVVTILHSISTILQSTSMLLVASIFLYRHVFMKTRDDRQLALFVNEQRKFLVQQQELIVDFNQREEERHQHQERRIACTEALLKQIVDKI